jgi:hypothetical protein
VEKTFFYREKSFSLAAYHFFSPAYAIFYPEYIVITVVLYASFSAKTYRFQAQKKDASTSK